MCDCFSSLDIAILQTLIANDAILQTLIANEQAAQTAAQQQGIEIFQNTLAQADPNMIDRTSGIAGDGDAGLVAVASAIGLPLSEYDPSLWLLLKGFIFNRLQQIRSPYVTGYFGP